MLKFWFRALVFLLSMGVSVVGNSWNAAAAQPSDYLRQANFTDWSQNYPDRPHDGTDLDDEFNAVKVTLDEVLENLALIQRDDGEIANNSIGADQLRSDIDLSINPVGDWATATGYLENDAVWKDNILYRCLEAHTSGTFSTDLAAVKWDEILDFATPLNAASASATSATASASSASVSATSATASASSASASATSATASAVAAAASAASLNMPTVAGNALKVLRVNAGATAYELATLAGGGDMVAAQNLADVANAATAFGNIKQASSTTATGVVELATDAEAQAGTDTARAITAANLQAVTSTETRKGVVELTTDAEAQAGTDTARAITAANLQAVTSTETRKGVVELATTAECTTGTDTARSCTPAGVAAAISASGAGDFYLVSTQTASASSSLNFTDLSSACSAYQFVLSDILPATNSVQLLVRTSTDNGVSYDSGASDYDYRIDSYDIDAAPASPTISGSSAMTAFRVADGLLNTSGQHFSGSLTLYNPSNTNTYKKIISEGMTANSGSQSIFTNAVGERKSSSDIDAVRFLMSSGNITSGKIRMYCISAS